MRRLARLIAGSFLSMAALVSVPIPQAAAAPAAAQPASKSRVVVHLSHFTDNLHAAVMAVQLAGMLQSKGAQVTLVLDVEGARLADPRQPMDLRWGPNEELGKLLATFLGAGGKALVCPHCAQAVGIEAKGLRQGIRIGTHDEMTDTLLQADRIIDY